VDSNEQELGREDELSEDIAEQDDNHATADAALLDEDDLENGFIQEYVDPEDLVTGFNDTIHPREIDVDEDTQGDEGIDTNGEVLLTRFEVADNGDDVHGDEVELDLQEALETGRTVREAPESN